MNNYRLIEYEIDRLLDFMWNNFRFFGDKVRGQTVLITTNYKHGRIKPARGGYRYENKNRY